VQAGQAETTFEVYVGPRDFFKMKEAGFEQAFPIGMLGQIGLGIILLLRGIASVVRNYGVAILLLSGIVTIVLSPFTLMSVRSMKKLQQLQPKMDQLKKKYENDKTRLNQEMFALFKQHKVSPASGCLPMLLQIPFFFAFWSAISHSVEFRGASFLWIKDLSLPDRLAHLPFGFDLNILPIAMAAAMFFQTKMSQPSSASSAPGAKLFSGPLMSVIFGVMFYQVPSCLVLYWLTNSLFSLAIYRTIKT
jgi:YidC/Oxa1 family membrane protein insertase